MVIAIAPLVIAVIGLLLWCMAANSKAAEAGRIMFFCGMLVLTMSLASKTFHLG